MTRPTAAPTCASNSGSGTPVSRRPAGWRTSTGRRQLPWTAACWTPASPWSFSTSASTCSGGPAGVGKSFLAQALGYSAARAGHTVRFTHADGFFKAMAQARVDNSVDRTFRSFLTADLLILDDLGLHALTAQQSADLYELILNRHRASSFVITSNRAVDEWLGLFNDPVLGNSALDRPANASYQIVIQGDSYRERLSPHRALLGKGGDCETPRTLIQ